MRYCALQGPSAGPAFLLEISHDFNGTFVGCIPGITLLAAALSRYLLVEMKRWEQALGSLGAVLMVAPGLISTLLGAAVAAPMLMHQWASWRRLRPAVMAQPSG